MFNRCIASSQVPLTCRKGSREMYTWKFCHDFDCVRLLKQKKTINGEVLRQIFRSENEARSLTNIIQQIRLNWLGHLLRIGWETWSTERVVSPPRIWIGETLNRSVGGMAAQHEEIDQSIGGFGGLSATESGSPLLSLLMVVNFEWHDSRHRTVVRMLLLYHLWIT